MGVSPNQPQQTKRYSENIILAAIAYPAIDKWGHFVGVSLSCNQRKQVTNEAEPLK